MAIFKAVVHSDYAQIPNETAQDESLSFEARGLLTMLLSLPPHWEVHKSWVVDKSPAGKDKVNSIFKELTDAGYIRREEGQRKFGKFAADDYFVFATKTTVADLPKRLDRSGSTGDGEPATRKETALEKKHREKKHSNAPSGATPAKPSLCGVKFETRDGVWNCPDDYYQACCDQYGQHNVDGEFKNAAFWLLSNPAKRKTVRGMKKFLGSWLQRKAERDPTFKPVELPTPTKRNFHTGELTEQQKADSERGRALLSGLKGNLG